MLFQFNQNVISLKCFFYQPFFGLIKEASVLVISCGLLAIGYQQSAVSFKPVAES